MCGINSLFLLKLLSGGLFVLLVALDHLINVLFVALHVDSVVILTMVGVVIPVAF